MDSLNDVHSRSSRPYRPVQRQLVKYICEMPTSHKLTAEHEAQANRYFTLILLGKDFNKLSHIAQVNYASIGRLDLKWMSR